MRINWKGHGLIIHKLKNKSIILEWDRIDGFNVYTVYSINYFSQVKVLLDIRIQDWPLA